MSTRVKVEATLLLILTAYAVGRWTAHPDVRTDVRFQDRVVVRQQVVTKTVDHVVADRAEAKQKVITVYRDKLVSGEVKTVTRIEYRDRVKVQTVHDTATATSATTQATDTRQTETITSPMPRWTLTAGAGFDLHLSPVVHLSASYRLIGPVSVGLWSSIPTADPMGSAVGVQVGFSF